MITLYPADKMDAWLEGNLREWVRPGNPLGLYHHDGQTAADSERWPAEANGGVPPTRQEVVDWQSNVTDVERLAAASTTVFIDKRREATLYLDKIKGNVHAALVFSGECDNAAATTEGVKFVEYHTVSLTTFKDCGGHPLAAQRLLAAIMSEGSKSLFDWLNIPAVAAVFENSLTY